MALDARFMEMIRKAKAKYSSAAGNELSSLDPSVIAENEAHEPHLVALKVPVFPYLVRPASEATFNDVEHSARRQLVSTMSFRTNPGEALEVTKNSTLGDYDVVSGQLGQADLEELVHWTVLELDALGVHVDICANNQEMRVVAHTALQLAEDLFALAKLYSANTKPRYRLPAHSRSGSVVPFIRPV